MQNCTFRQKINKEHSVVLRQLSRFRNTWQGRTIEPSKIQTYCNLVGYITQLHSSYVYNCMEYFTPIMKQEMIKVNKTVVEDLVKKIKYFSQYSLKSQKSYLQKEKKQICQLCSSKILQVDTRIIKEHLSDDASLRRNFLRKIYADLQNQNDQLFSKDEDQVFFRFLNIILVRKEELLAMQTKELNGFLSEVTKSLTDLNFLTEYTPGNTGVGLQRENYKQDLSKTITQTLKSGFDHKIHPWMKKVFQSVKKQILTQKNAPHISASCQTQDDLQLTKKRSQYITASENKRQVQQLKQEIQKSTITITDLKTKLTVLQKQKRQLEQEYATQVESLLLSKREIQLKLRKTQTDFYQLKQTNEEIIEVNKRLRNEKKKTQLSWGNKSNKSVKDLSNVSRQGQDGINEGKSEKSESKSIKRKKKSPINKLLSKRSQASQKALFIQQKSSQQEGVDNNKQKMGQNHLQPMLKKTASEIINKQQRSFQQQQSLLSIKKPLKKSLKNLDRPLSKKQKSKQNQQQKVQFKLHQQQQHSMSSKAKSYKHKSNKKSSLQIQKSLKSITQACKNNQQKLPSSLLKKKSQFKKQKQSKQNTTNRSNKNMKRMLSIEIGMVPNIKVSRQQQRKQRQQLQQQVVMNATVIEENQQGGENVVEGNYDRDDQNVRGNEINDDDDINNQSDANNNNNNDDIDNNNSWKYSTSIVPPPQTKKKVFQFIPLQNHQQYQQIKQKVTQITAKIEQKTTQKLKSSIKHIQLQQKQQQLLDNTSEVGRVYGQSIFGKTSSIMVGKGRSKQHYNKNNSNDDNDQDNNNNNNNINNPTTIQQTNQHNSNKPSPLHSLINNSIPLTKRKLLYQQMKRQQTIPMSITFEHYELMVRKLFNQLSKQDQVILLLLMQQLQKQGYGNKKRQQQSLLLTNRDLIVSGVSSPLMISSSSPTNNNNNILSLKYNNNNKHHMQSSKINIDSKSLQQNNKFNNTKINNQLQKLQKQQKQQQSNINNSNINSKVILNLPKLDRKARANYNVNVNMSMSNNNTMSNTKMAQHSILLQNHQRSHHHFNINTMRQRLNGAIKDQKQQQNYTNNNDHMNVNVNLNSNSNDDVNNKIVVPQKDNNNHNNNNNNASLRQQQQSKQQITIIKTAQNTPSSLLKRFNQYSTSNNSPKHSQPFTQKDLYIFFDSQLTAYQYQQHNKYNKYNKSNNTNSNSKANNIKQLKQLQHQLNSHQKQTISSLYSILIQIKQKNHQLYHKICSFLKYPYQTVKHGFQFINITKQLTFQKWACYLLTLYKLKCIKSNGGDNNSNKSMTTMIAFKQFIKPFEEKMVQLFIDVSSNSSGK